MEQPLQFYTKAQVAEFLQLHERTVSRLIRDGQVKAVRFGATIRISSLELYRLADEAGVKPPAGAP